MSSIFSYLTRFFQQKYTKSLLVFGMFIVIGVCFGAETSSPQYETADLTKNIIEIFDLLFGLLALILGPMVILAGWLLSPDWTMGDFFGLRGYFKEVWILVANIVYIIFALMLLYMAIMQIFGGSESDYAFKKKLPSFLVGILLVPFTWLIVSWTLSFANQAVAAVLSIPMGAIHKLDTGGTPGKQNTSQWHRKVLPTQFDFSDGTSGYGPGVKCEGGTLADNSSVRCISPAEFLSENQAGPFFIIMVYAYNIFKIQEADITRLETLCTGKESNSSDTQYKSAKTCVEDLMGIVRNFGLSLIITVFFAIMLIALCWILLMRAIKLWIYVMLSPLFGLAYFTGKGFGESTGEAGESGFGQVGFKQFFKLAMVPVLVSAVLAFGLLFVGVVRDNFNGAKDPNQKEFCTEQNVGYMVTYCITEKTEGTDKVYTSRLIIGTDNDLSNGDAKITLNFGDSFSKIISTSEATSVAAGAVSGGISSVEDIFAHIILTMLALVFMFMGVKVAANFDPVTEAAFKPFAKLGESVGNFVAHSPSYLPLPHPAFAAITNPAFASEAARMINTKISNEKADFGRSIHDIVGGKTGNLNTAIDNLSTASGSLDEVARAMKNMEYKSPKEAREAILKAIDNSDLATKNNEEVKKFRAEIEADRNGSSIATNIERFTTAVEVMEKDQKTRGIRKIGEYQGAQSESASEPFHNARFEGGNITIGDRDVVKKNVSGGYDVGDINSDEKSHINKALPRGSVIPSTPSEVNDLFKKVFRSNVPDSQLSWQDKRAILGKIQQR